MPKRDLMKRETAFTKGYHIGSLALMFALMIASDIVGKEGSAEWVRNRWIDSRISLPICILGSVVMLLLYVNVRRKARREDAGNLTITVELYKAPPVEVIMKAREDAEAAYGDKNPGMLKSTAVVGSTVIIVGEHGEAIFVCGRDLAKLAGCCKIAEGTPFVMSRDKAQVAP